MECLNTPYLNENDDIINPGKKIIPTFHSFPSENAKLCIFKEYSFLAVFSDIATCKVSMNICGLKSENVINALITEIFSRFTFAVSKFRQVVCDSNASILGG